jgi:predicted permease
LLTEIVPLKRQLVEDVSGTLALLFGAVGVVLLIACANVANLLLVRSAKRAREFAVRAALGSQTGHIVRQLLSESVLIALVGGVVGLAVAVAALKIGLASFSTNLPRTGDIGLNPYVLLFALAVSMLAGIVFGLAPVWQTRGVDIQEALKQGGRGSLAGHRVQNALSMAQVAMTLILLAGAGLLFRTIRHLWQVNPGFETHNVVAFRAGLPPDAATSPSAMRAAYGQLLGRLRKLPGIEQADLTTLIPLSDADNSVPFWIGLQKLGPSAEAPRALAFLTGPDYLRVMGIPLLQGRFFAMSDTVNSPHVVVVDEEFARKYFSAGNAVGQSITIANVGAYQIVGVVGHVRHWGLGNPGPYAQLQIYTSFFQLSDEWLAVLHNDTNFVVRTPLDASALMPEIKLAIYAPGAEQPVYDIQRIQQIISHSMSSQRVPMVLLGIFAGLALLLASIGIYGVISYSMAQRVQEIGIRMALGAEKGSILRMVIGEGVKLATAGLTIGIIGSVALTCVLSSYSRLLYGVSATDPLTFVAVAVLILVVTVAACFLPARRATTVDPMVALRCE